MTTYQPPAGLIGLTSIHGNTGKSIEFGQWINGDGFKAWEHAFMALGDRDLIVEAEPGGARVAHAAKYETVYWCHNLHSLGTAEQHGNAAFYARRYTEAGPWGPHGVPYSFLDYGAVFLHRLHVPVPGLRKFIATGQHMICSQLVDRCDTRAGIEIFADRRWDGYVDPLSLYNRDIALAAR